MTTILERTYDSLVAITAEMITYLATYFTDKLHLEDPTIIVALSFFVPTYVIFYLITKIAYSFSHVKMTLLVLAFQVFLVFVSIDCGEDEARIAKELYVFNLNEEIPGYSTIWVTIMLVFSIKTIMENAYYSNLFNRNNS